MNLSRLIMYGLGGALFLSGLNLANTLSIDSRGLEELLYQMQAKGEVKAPDSNAGAGVLYMGLGVAAVVGATYLKLDPKPSGLPEPFPVAKDGKKRPAKVQPQAEQVIQGKTLVELWAQKADFATLINQLDYEARRALLDKTISSHEGGWIESLLCCPCLLVIGRPGSAKSSFAAALAICREVLLDNLRKTIVTDPNAHLKVETKTWQPHWELNGSRDNWGEVNDAIGSMYQRFADSQGDNYVSSIYDELTAYEGNVNADRLGGFLPQITSKARAAEEYITLVSHNDTLSCLGGKAGQAKLKDDMVQLNLGSISAGRGKFKPSGKGCIEGLTFDEKLKPLEQAITLPRWFDPAILIELFPEVYGGDLEVETPPLGEEFDDRSTTVRQAQPFDSRTALERPSNESNELYRSTQLERIIAVRQAQKLVQAETGVFLVERTISNALDALEKDIAKSEIIKGILGMGSEKYNQGKYILQIIEQTASNSGEV